MNITQTIALLEKIRTEDGDLQVCFLSHRGVGYSFEFPNAIAPIGMPHESDEDADETLVCAFLHHDVTDEAATDDDLPPPVLGLVR